MIKNPNTSQSDVDYTIPLDQIKDFLENGDDEKYIVNLEYDYKTNTIFKIKHYPDGKKEIVTDQLQAFMFMKELTPIREDRVLFNGNVLLFRDKLKEYGMKIIPLRHDDQPLLKEGFRYLLTCDKGERVMLNFFIDGGIYKGIYNPKYKDLFYKLQPKEQYLISTRKRFYKGYENYSDIERFCFDLETTGLDPNIHRIFLIGCKTNKGFEEIISVDIDGDNPDKSERDAIIKFFEYLDNVKAAINIGYNSFNFDWDFIFKRCEILKLDVKKIAKTLDPKSTLVRKKSSIKIGGDVEDFEQVQMFGYSNIDTIHAVRRAQAIDSSMKSSKLKYVCQYNKIAKQNRVYVKGELIGKIWSKNETYYFDDNTGRYLKNKPVYEFVDNIEDFTPKHNYKIILSDDIDTKLNAFQIPTKKNNDIFSDENYKENKVIINKYIKKIINDITTGTNIYIPTNYKIYFNNLVENAPKTRRYILSRIKKLMEYIDNDWQEVNGQYIIKRYLMDDLWETLEVDNVYNQSSFMLTKLLPMEFEKMVVKGTAALWKYLMLDWSYQNYLAIPISAPTRKFVGGLSRVVKLGFCERLRKTDFNSLYPAIMLLHNLFPSADIMGVMKSFLKYFHSERFLAKGLAKKYKKEGDLKTSSLYSRKQLPLKIFINAMFGSISAPNIFPWGDINIGEQITCSARQYLRLMIIFFVKRGYEVSVLDTDGINFVAPLNEFDYKYIGKGLNSETKEGQEYTGTEAVIAEFNDLFMRKEMALGFDGSWPATINLSRKNYVLLEEDGSLSLTGATIKSKTIETYIEEFFQKTFDLIINKKQIEFIQYYYDYIDKIYNKQIPLSKIANKAKVNSTIEEYLNRGVDKNGKEKNKQAHMELVIQNNIPVHKGDVVYYVNIGTKKTQGDIQTKYECSLDVKQRKQYKIENGVAPGPEFYTKKTYVNAVILDNDFIENNPEELGDYNVERYIYKLNKKLKPILVCFDKSIRDKILIDNPSQKREWLDYELELVNSQPLKEGDQDTMEEILTPSDMELEFWNKLNYKPDFWFDDDILFELPGLDLGGVVKL